MDAYLLSRYYKIIGQRLMKTERWQALGSDYGYVAELIEFLPNTKRLNMGYLIAQLRNNLNRSDEYLDSEKRNATLHVMAKTLERSMK